MSGTVHYRRLDNPKRFDELGVPAVIKYRPTAGLIIVEVDARDLDEAPHLVHQLNELSDALIAPYDMRASPLDKPTLACQMHRVLRLPGGRLLAHEVVGDVAHVEIVGRVMSADLAGALTALGTNVGRYLDPG